MSEISIPEKPIAESMADPIPTEPTADPTSEELIPAEPTTESIPEKQTAEEPTADPIPEKPTTDSIPEKPTAEPLIANQEEPIYILLQCGLSNRLRTLIGFWYIADQLNLRTIFHWDTDDIACNGLWNEIFESLTSVAGKNIHLFNTKKSNFIKYTFVGHDMIGPIIKNNAPQLFPENYSKNIWDSPFIIGIENKYYSRLRPKQYVLNEVDSFFRLNGGKKAIGSNIYYNYASMHIRRTDHSELAKLNNLYTTYEEFDKFISDCKEKKIFLATDSLDVQKKYTSCLIYKQILKNNKDNFRQTNLADALIDMLIAAKCVRFKGSGYSSYSRLIIIFSRINAI